MRSQVAALLYSLGHRESINLLLTSRTLCRVVLVTSDLGIRRALRLFKKEYWRFFLVKQKIGWEDDRGGILAEVSAAGNLDVNSSGSSQTTEWTPRQCPSRLVWA